jgi:hypothetical protein
MTNATANIAKLTVLFISFASRRASGHFSVAVNYIVIYGLFDALEMGLEAPECHGLCSGQTVDLFGNHHLAGLGLALDAVGEVHRGADNALFHTAFGADVPHYHFASVETDAHVQRGITGLGHVLVFHGRLHLQGAADGPPHQRLQGAGQGIEKGQNSVSQEVHNDPPVCLDHFDHPGKVAVRPTPPGAPWEKPRQHGQNIMELGKLSHR